MLTVVRLRIEQMRVLASALDVSIMRGQEIEQQLILACGSCSSGNVRRIPAVSEESWTDEVVIEMWPQIGHGAPQSDESLG
jgi:hypothetical protein